MNDPLTREQAREFRLPGWNLRCNLCGSYGGQWVTNGRPGWGDLALCESHRLEYYLEEERHRNEMSRLRKINFEQDIPKPYHGPQVWD